ncbi:ABC transporter substrate-binding protein [Marmoricola sp. OAE513]|uniref:ABC transporter substrate-binding protein n=1 Tax=Marmoricola sp. OAE513 TaxID=2817894 RepID=UPI001AEB1780
MNSGRPPLPPYSRVLVGVTAVLALALSACGGSAMSPKEAARANGGVNGTLGSGPGDARPVASVSDGPVTSDGPVVTDASGNPSAPTSGDQGGPNGTVVGGAAPPTGKGVKAASCAGFKNTTGITDSTITIGNVSDISGPVPGIFTPALQATQAYAAYFNSRSKICGRKIVVKSYDSQTNTSAEQVATQKSCDETFAGVGGLAGFDGAGAGAAIKCGIPEIHAVMPNAARVACPNCFAANAPQGGFFPASIPDYFTRTNKAATQKAAMLYVNAAASVQAAKGQVRSEENRGWKFALVRSFDIAEFNYGPYVQQLKSSGARIVQLFGSADMGVRFARAFDAAGYKPDVFLLNPTYYDPAFANGGSVVDGSVVYVDFTPLEEAGSSPELRLYKQWLAQVAPGATPTYFGLYAWSATRLFAEQATALGGQLTRANLVKRFRAVHGWTANGLHAPQDVGGKKSARCVRFLQVKGGSWRPYGGTKYHCGGLSSIK